MLGEDFFTRATDHGAMSGDTSIGDLLDAWDIDLGAFLGWMVVYRNAVHDHALTEEDNISCALLAGFETGYRARLAVEEAASS
jgi:hypothetical protein